MDYTCKTCQKTFWAYRFQKRIYCSQECHFKDHTVVRKCPNCGKEKQEQKARPVKDFCSIDCWNIFRRKRVTYTCKTCKKDIEGHVCKVRKYCSKKCLYIGKLVPKEEQKRKGAERLIRYRKENPEKTRAWKNNRRSRQLKAEGSFTGDEWKELCNKFENKCAFCKKESKLTVDHIIPLSKGGSNYITNIQPLCMPCNSKKHIKII